MIDGKCLYNIINQNMESTSYTSITMVYYANISSGGIYIYYKH